MEEVLLILYIVLGYWATGRTIYKNSVLIGTTHGIFMKKWCTGVLLGWILIPIALIGLFFGKKE